MEKQLQQLPNGMTLQHTQPHHTIQLELLQKIVFPALGANELLKAPHYVKHIELFPEGQMVVTKGGQVVAMTTTMRSDFDFSNYRHTFNETIAGGWMTNHNPHGGWLYGLDIGVHPDYRGMGLAKHLYHARQQLAKNLHLKGQITVGMMNGYSAAKHLLSAEAYYQELLSGKRTDPTITPQTKMGFQPVALIENYVNDPTCGNYGVLLRWDLIK